MKFDKSLEIAKKWIEKADRDLLSARKLFEEGIYDYALFHAQQAIEKYLKAFLVSRNRPLRKTHDISWLIEQCAKIDPDFLKLYDIGADELYPIGIEVRYPTSTEVLREDIEEAIEIAKKVGKFVKRKIISIRGDRYGL